MVELVILVDESNNEIGTMEKLAAHNANTPLHRAFSLFLFNSKGELLLQQRALSKKTWPGVWSNSCCGHPAPGEPIKQAIDRRLKYELGLEPIEYHLILPAYRYRVELNGIVENEICPVYVGSTDQLPKPNPEEVETIEYISWPKFLSDQRNSSKYSAWSIEETQLLNKNQLFISFLRRGKSII
jgi:isopentenyl-diphosphate Delta-isomerase